MADLEINVTGRERGASSVMQSVRRELEQLSNTLRQLEGTTDGSNRALAESIIRYQGASREAIGLKAEFKSLQRSGEGTEEMFRSLSERIELAQNKAREAIEETRKLATVFQNSGDEAAQFSDEMRFLNEQLDRSQGYIDGVGVEAKQTNTAISGLGTEVKQLGNATKEMGQDTKRGADGIERVGNEARRTGEQLKRMNDSALGSRVFANIISEVMEEAIYAIARFATESVQEFWDFDRSIREITTLIPGATGTMREEMGEDIQALSIDLGRMSEEMLPAVYQALSSGRGNSPRGCSFSQ